MRVKKIADLLMKLAVFWAVGVVFGVYVMPHLGRSLSPGFKLAVLVAVYSALTVQYVILHNRLYKEPSAKE
jgi:hypothetical protein